jgi:3'(2'), 5'-bisphosphate nucleotidase
MIETIDIEKINQIIKEAGVKVLEIYNQDFEVEYKEDSSPLTIADMEANRIICTKLRKLYPNIPILSEENEQIEYKIRKEWEYYWCIDPIDGTREFIAKNGEFTLNIALIHQDKPVLGVVYAPVLDDIYYAKQGYGAYKNNQKLPLKTNPNPKENLYIVTSKSHLNDKTLEYIKSLDTKNIKYVPMGSSLKICLVAEGVADIYPRLGPCSEWDTAAADAIVKESGKMIYQFDTNKPLIYNKEDLLNPWFVVK